MFDNFQYPFIKIGKYRIYEKSDVTSEHFAAILLAKCASRSRSTWWAMTARRSWTRAAPATRAAAVSPS
eukprot:985521-Prymnesium_polylepis.1